MHLHFLDGCELRHVGGAGTPEHLVRDAFDLRLLARLRQGFQQVEQFYGRKRIPEDEFFLNTLAREFSIPRNRADVFANLFLENLK